MEGLSPRYMGAHRTRGGPANHGHSAPALLSPRYGAPEDYEVAPEYVVRPDYGVLPEGYAAPPLAPSEAVFGNSRPPPPTFVPQAPPQPPPGPSYGMPSQPMSASMPGFPPPLVAEAPHEDAPRLRVRVLRGEKIKAGSPFVMLSFSRYRRPVFHPTPAVKTKVMAKGSHKRGFPTWNERLEIVLPSAPEAADVLTLELWTLKKGSAEFRGSCHMPMAGLNVDLAKEAALPVFSFSGRLFVEVTANFEPLPSVHAVNDCILEAARETRIRACTAVERVGAKPVPIDDGRKARRQRNAKKAGQVAVVVGEVAIEVLVQGGLLLLAVVGSLA